MDRGHISDIERGKREVGIITLQVIAKGLDTEQRQRLISVATTPVPNQFSGGCAPGAQWLISTWATGSLVLGAFLPGRPLGAKPAVFLSSRSAPFNFVLASTFVGAKTRSPSDPFF